jgi:queuine tRNA-ribosyltransferase
MTDSGGYQVFSLGVAYKKGISKVLHPVDPSLQIPERSSADDGVPRLATIGNDGVSFQSHLDGSLHYITPEKSIEIQHALGADMIFAFDECTSPTEDVRYQEEALARTHAWAARCLKRHHELKDESEKSEVKLGNTPDALFGVVQGGREEELRKKSAQVLADMRTEDGHEYDGFGIGGSFAKEDMGTAVRWVNEVLPEDKPRHLLGIGEPEDLFMGVENGCDLFDCVLPTRNGRNGTIFTHQGKIHIENAKYRQDYTPIEEGCGCYACQNFTRAYVCHLFHGKEMLAGTLASIHNLYFINNLMERIRASIADGTFYELKESFLVTYTQK